MLEAALWAVLQPFALSIKLLALLLSAFRFKLLALSF